MRAATHVATGSLLVVAIPNPWISLPLALVSHFLLDMLPHYGDLDDQPKQFAALKYLLPIDALVGLLIIGAVILLGGDSKYLIAFGGILCASPDLWQLPRYIRYLRTGNWQPLDDWLSQFHHNIQQLERPSGAYFEIPWFIVTVALLFSSL